MATEKGYQGWTNYETWAVALWIDNERSSYEYWREQAEHTLDELNHDSDEHEYSDAAVALGDEMEESFENDFEAIQDKLGHSVFSDLLGSSLSEVDWYEIAEKILDDMVD